MSVVYGIAVRCYVRLFLGDVHQVACRVVDGHIIEAVQMVREAGVDCNIGYVEDPDVSYADDLHFNIEGAGSEVQTFHFEPFLPEIIITWDIC